MKLLSRSKDGGAESHVWAYWLVELKHLGSVALLQFLPGSRDAFHSHAFSAVSWVLRGRLEEEVMERDSQRTLFYGTMVYTPSWRPIWTPRRRCHKVTSVGTTWVLTFRGPWARTWKEYLPGLSTLGFHGRTLTWGRKELPSLKELP
jgi:hypothetical protein